MFNKHLRLSQEEAKTYKWRVVRDHVAKNVPSTYTNLGVVNFDASTFNNLETSSEDYNYPFYNMLESLWPGYWRQQLSKMNSKMKDHNTSFLIADMLKNAQKMIGGRYRVSSFLQQRLGKVALTISTTRSKNSLRISHTLICRTYAKASRPGADQIHPLCLSWRG